MRSASASADRRIDYIVVGRPRRGGVGHVVRCALSGAEPVAGVVPPATTPSSPACATHVVNPRFDVITFDCYGTLIDWETGMQQAFAETFAAEWGAARSAPWHSLSREQNPSLTRRGSRIMS
jgi:hypothetical protein